MVTQRSSARRATVRAAPDAPVVAKRWLLFVHQLPSKPSNIRVRVWRRLQQIGALVIKQAVYVLPDSSEAREDFEWLKTEIEGVGGQASILSADHIDVAADEALVEEFRRARQEDYASLARAIERGVPVARAAPARGTRALRGERRPIQAFRQRLAAIERIDFFDSAGRDGVVALIDQMTRHGSPARRSTPLGKATGAGRTYHARLWVTRPGPGVDRMASAWLIRRFIDPDAAFDFVRDREKAPNEALPFDMFGVEFGHRGTNCTFETLCEIFGIADPGIARVAAIVHDLDLKDERFGAPESATIGAVIEGLRLADINDQERLDRGMTLFEALYRSFAQAAKQPRPRRVARPQSRRKGRAR